MHIRVRLPGALFVLAVFSAGHTQTWNSQEHAPAPPPLATFPLLAPACWVLGSRKQETREVSWKWGQGHDVVPQSDPEGSRRAELDLEELGVLAIRFHFSQPQAWFKSHCVCRHICLSGKQTEARS